MRRQALGQVPGLALALVQQLREQVREQALGREREQVLALERVQQQQDGERQWHHHSRLRPWQASSWHRASSILGCRFSKPAHWRNCASCQQFERRRRSQVLR